MSDPLDDIKKTHRQMARGAGGSEGGCGMFSIGFLLCAGGIYLFLDSVRATTAGFGWLSGGLHGGGRMGETTSMGLIFVPFFIGVIILFYNSKLKLGWGLMFFGLVIIMVEIVSRIRFYLNMKTTHLLLLFVMIAGGLGLILRSFRDKSLLKE
tara:strand:- start:315 stop:773 length:459 start_codon:yes stop_codon:yes gene_type:complete